MGKVSLICIWRKRTGFVLGGDSRFCVREYHGQAFSYCYHRLNAVSTSAMRRSQKQMANMSAKAKQIWADPLQKQMWLDMFAAYQSLRQQYPYLTSEMLLVRLGLIRPIVQADCSRLIVDGQGVRLAHYRTRRRQKNPYYKTAWMMLVGATTIQQQQGIGLVKMEEGTTPKKLSVDMAKIVVLCGLTDGRNEWNEKSNKRMLEHNRYDMSTKRKGRCTDKILWFRTRFERRNLRI